jgi:hypothetical protein
MSRFAQYGECNASVHARTLNSERQEGAAKDEE